MCKGMSVCQCVFGMLVAFLLCVTVFVLRASACACCVLMRVCVCELRASAGVCVRGYVGC